MTAIFSFQIPSRQILIGGFNHPAVYVGDINYYFYGYINCLRGMGISGMHDDIKGFNDFQGQLKGNWNSEMAQAQRATIWADAGWNFSAYKGR